MDRPMHTRLTVRSCSDNFVAYEVHLLLDCCKFNDIRRDFVTSCFNKNINRANDICFLNLYGYLVLSIEDSQIY